MSNGKFRAILYFLSVGILPGGGGGGGGLRYETGGDARRLAQGCKFGCLVSLRVSQAKTRYFKPSRSRLGLHTKKKREINYIFTIFGFF